MADERLMRDEDVEEILRLAVRESVVDGADLRERLSASASELGISEEQLRLAEEKYFREREEAAERAQEEQVRAEKKRKEQRENWMFIGGGVLVLAVVALMAFAGGSGSGVWVFGVIFPALMVRRMRERGFGTSRDLERDDD